MPVEIQGVFDAIGQFFANPLIQLAIQAAGVYVVILWLAAAFWAFRDLQLRTDNPVLPYLASTLIIVFTPVFFPLAVIVYRVIRPQERIGEVSERQLAEEALLAEVDNIRTCPTCSRRVHEEWLICPTCRTRLNRVCPHCGKLVGLDWSLCAWCGKDFERREPIAGPMATPAMASPALTELPSDSRPVTVRSRGRAGARGSGDGRQATPRPSPLAQTDALTER